VRHRPRELRRQQGGRCDRGLRDAADRARARVGALAPRVCDGWAMSFVCLIEIHLHFPDNGSLKGKRKEIVSLKAQLQRRFGAAVSETDHHDLWQRATVTAALVGRDAGTVAEAGAKLERYVESHFQEGVRTEKARVSGAE